jgi:uncharacterized protein
VIVSKLQSTSICGIAVMAKASRPGRTKTRLVPPLSYEEAADLNTAFLRDAFANIAEAGCQAPIRAFAAYGPTGEEGFFDSVGAVRPGLIAAVNANFGDCLLAGIDGVLAAGCASACVLNADTPDLPTDYLLHAARALQGGSDRMVIGPADDGGYYILGVSRPHAYLFEQIDWSTERVFVQTLARAIVLGLDIVTLPKWCDIDDADSLRRFAQTLDEPDAPGDAKPFAAPNSRAQLRRSLRESDLAARLGLTPPTRVAAE